MTDRERLIAFGVGWPEGLAIVSGILCILAFGLVLGIGIGWRIWG
jgi:hypothetical protein